MHLWCLMPGLSLAPLIPWFLRLTVYLKLLWLFPPSSPWGIVSFRKGDKSALLTVMMMKTSLMTDTKMSDFCWRISRLDNSRKRQANFDQLVHTELLYNVRQQWLCKKLRNEEWESNIFWDESSIVVVVLWVWGLLGWICEVITRKMLSNWILDHLVGLFLNCIAWDRHRHSAILWWLKLCQLCLSIPWCLQFSSR